MLGFLIEVLSRLSKAELRRALHDFRQILALQFQNLNFRSGLLLDKLLADLIFGLFFYILGTLL